VDVVVSRVGEKCIVELNVAAQVRNCYQNEHVVKAIHFRRLEVHGFVYDVALGRCRVVYPIDK